MRAATANAATAHHPPPPSTLHLPSPSQESIDPSLRPGAAGEIGMESSNKTKLRRGAAGGKRGAVLATTVKLDPSSATPMLEQLRDVLFKNAVRVIDLFRDCEWRGVSIPLLRLDPAVCLGLCLCLCVCASAAAG